MKVRFNGMFRDIKTGCAPCGHRVQGKRAFMTNRTFILPSGLTMAFRLGEVYEVSELDGNFLLTYSQVDKDGLRQDSFTEVE